MLGTVFDLRGQVSADVSPFNTAMDASAHMASRSFQAMQLAASTFIGSGVIRTFIKATDAANKFGQTLADISSIADYNLKSLRSSIMGLDNVYGRASKVGETMYEIISSGVHGSEQELIEFTKVAKQTAVSIKADLYDTANVLTTLTNAYGLGIKDVQKLSDMLFVTVREGKAHGNELARTLGLVTNTAAEAGVSLTEMAATISVLSRTQSASQSMIGFNQLLNAIIKPTQEAEREARYWGIELNATTLKAKGLTEILQEMHDKTGGNVRAINAMLGNIRAMRAGVSLTGRQFENFINVLRTAKTEIGSGVAFEAFKKQTATAAQTVENFRTQLDKTYVTIGKDFEPVTRSIASGFESLLKSFSGENNTFGRLVTYLSVGALTLNGVIKTISGIKSLTSAINNHTKALITSANSVDGGTKSISNNLEMSSRHTDTLSKLARITANGMRDIEVHANKALVAINAMSEGMSNAVRNSVMMNSAFSSLSSSIHTPVPLTTEQAEVAKKHLIAQTLTPENLRSEAMSNLRKTGQKLPDYTNTIKELEDARTQHIRYKRHLYEITRENDNILMRAPVGRFALANKLNDMLLSERRALAQYDENRYKKIIVSGLRTDTTRYKNATGRFVPTTEAQPYLSEIDSHKSRITRLESVIEHLRISNTRRERRIAQLRKDIQIIDDDVANGLVEIDKSISKIDKSIEAYTVAQSDVSAVINEEATRIRNVRLRRYDRAELLTRFEKQIKSIEGRAQMKAESEATVTSVKGRPYDIFDRYNSMRVHSGLAPADADLFARKQVRQELSRQLRSAAGRRQMQDASYALVRDIQTQRMDAVTERYLRRFGYTDTSSVSNGDDVRNQIRNQYSKNAERVNRLTVDQAKVLARFNRRYDAHLKMLPTEGMRVFSRNLRMVTTRLPSVFGKFTAGLGTILSTVGIWTFAASAVGHFGKMLIEKASEVELKNIKENQDKQMLTGYRALAYSRLSTAWQNKTLTEAEYRLYDSSIRLANSQEALSKILDEIRRHEQKKTKKSLADEYAEAEKAHAARVAKIKEDYRYRPSRISSKQSEDLKAYIRSNPMEVNAEDGIETLSIQPRLRSLGALAPKVISDTSLYDTPTVKALKGTEDIDKALLEAFSKDNWRTAVSALRDKFYTVLYDASTTDVEKEFMLQLVKRINQMTRIRENNADSTKWLNDALKESLIQELSDKADAVNRMAEDAIYDEIHTVRAKASVRTIDNTGASAAYNTIDELLKVKQKADAEVATQTERLDALVKEYANKGLSEDDIKKQLKGNYDRLTVTKTQANKALDNLYAVFEDHTGAIDRAIEEASYAESGMRLKPKALAAKLTDMLKAQYTLFTQTNVAEKRAVATRGIQHIASELDSAMNDYIEQRLERMQLRKDAGKATKLQVMEAEVSARRYALRTERERMSLLPAGLDDIKKQRIEDASLRLRAALLKLNDAALDTSTSLRNGLMSQVQQFAEQRDSKGRMTNDALYHSINLMSRLGGGTAIQTSKGLNMSVSSGKFANFKNAQEAQNAVARSLDAYIVSQQYAEANKGKVVVDIYNLLKQNIGKGITVN